MRKKRPDEENRFYQSVSDIKAVASTGESVIRAMGSQKRMPFSLEDLHFIPAQVWKIPKNAEEPVNTRTVVGPAAGKPLVTESPVIVSGMSYGAVSENVRIIVSRVAGQTGFLFNSGEGGVLPVELSSAGRLIVQFSSGRFGITEELLKQAAAIEVRFGQGAYPGKGSILPAAKMTESVARARGLKAGDNAYSPAHHSDMTTPGEIQDKISWLKGLTGGVPVGAKIGCGHVEKDLDVLVSAGVDFIAIDGFGGGTGATAAYVRENVGIPLAAALPRADLHLKQLGIREQVTLIADGNLRTSADFAKCLSLGADAVYTGTAVLIAINCEQYRICHTGLCPTGVTTNNPRLVKQCDIEEGTRKLSNYLNVMTSEISGFTRIVGKSDIHELNTGDLVALTKEMAWIAGCQWVGDGDSSSA